MQKMVRPVPTDDEKPLVWIGSSLEDLKSMPREVQSEIGNALGVAQLGGLHPSVKPWKGEGSGVFEVVESYDGNAYRAVYMVRFKEAVYVLHVFQKKSRSGKKTPKRDVDLVTSRLKSAREHYEGNHGSSKS